MAIPIPNIPKRVNGYPYPQYPQAGKWLSISPISPSGKMAIPIPNTPMRENGYPYPQYPQAGKWLSLSPISLSE